MGAEFKAKGGHVQLGPGMNVQRVPTVGRAFEYLSGEDPVVGRELVPPMVRGIQSQKVLANAKHFIDNSQETNRTTVSENVDERTNFEMYYPPFQAAIDSDVASFMCSYNKIN
jgi:beta-glucosidase